MFEHLSKLFLLVLSYIVLACLVYILPAVAISVIFWDKTLYYACISHPLYAFFFGSLSIIGIGVYVIEISNEYLA
jgi:hypothetical protein